MVPHEVGDDELQMEGLVVRLTEAVVERVDVKEELTLRVTDGVVQGLALIVLETHWVLVVEEDRDPLRVGELEEVVQGVGE